LRAAGIGAGDEVITAPNTFVATVEAIEASGATPVLADVDPESWLLTPDTVEARITARTKAVLVVHLYGHVADLDGFHELFGLPNFLRGMTEHGQTRYELVTGGRTPFLGNGSTTAVGDVTIHAKKTLFDRHRSAVALRSDLKLPTGNPETLSGSGATDVGIGVAFDRIGERWGVYANVNYHFLGQPDTFESKNFFSFMVGGDWRFKPRLTAHQQSEHAAPFIVSELPIFNDPAEQLAIGLRWRYSDRFVYEWRFVEDFSDVSPDFTAAFQVGLRWARAQEEKGSK